MPKPPSEDPRLQQFLAEEVRDLEYVDLLLARAEAASQGKAVPEASGNAYLVIFERQRVVIEHHHLTGWQPLYLPTEDFIMILRRWRAQLKPV